MRSPLPRDFYARPAADLACALLGKHLVHRVSGALYSGRIVETEAYIGPADLACHARSGNTKRTRVMFGPPGHSYVFLVYGMHHCFNVVSDREGHAAAVLVRALEPDEGLLGSGTSTNGPGKLCAALAITRAENGLDLVGDQLWIEDRGGPLVEPIATPRIGVDYAGEWAAAPLRFVDPASTWLSRRLATKEVGSPRRSRMR